MPPLALFLRALDPIIESFASSAAFAVRLYDKAKGGSRKAKGLAARAAGVIPHPSSLILRLYWWFRHQEKQRPEAGQHRQDRKACAVVPGPVGERAGQKRSADLAENDDQGR